MASAGITALCRQMICELREATDPKAVDEDLRQRVGSCDRAESPAPDAHRQVDFDELDGGIAQESFGFGTKRTTLARQHRDAIGPGGSGRKVVEPRRFASAPRRCVQYAW